MSKYPKMNQLFKGQISCKAVFSKCARARYYHGILAATVIMTMVVFIVLAMNELLNNRSTNKKHGRKITVVPVDQGNHQSLQNRGQTFDYGFGERKVLLCMLVCKLIVPITSLVFFLIFFIVISVN